ncbi:MAG TPA: hypothetical protein VIG72_12570, partial [Pontibacter sp.]
MVFSEQQEQGIEKTIVASVNRSKEGAAPQTIVPEKVARALPHFQLEQDLPWVQVAPGAPYFMTDTSENWTPIGQNDAITWPDFEGLFRRRNMQQV